MTARRNRSRASVQNKKNQQAAQDKVANTLLKSLNAQPGQMFFAGMFKVSDMITVVEDTPTYLYNLLRGKAGATLKMYVDAATIATAAANTIRVEAYKYISAMVIEDSTDTDQYPRYDTVLYDCNWRSTTGCFIVVPFVCRLENGENVTNTNANTGDLPTTVLAATGAQDKVLIYCPMFYAHQETSTGYWSLKMAFDLAKLANYYSKYYSNKELEEEAVGVLGFGFAIISIPSNTVSLTVKRVEMFNLVDRSIF